HDNDSSPQAVYISGAPQGTAGNTITWTEMIRFKRAGEVDIPTGPLVIGTDPGAIHSEKFRNGGNAILMNNTTAGQEGFALLRATTTGYATLAIVRSSDNNQRGSLSYDLNIDQLSLSAESDAMR